MIKPLSFLSVLLAAMPIFASADTGKELMVIPQPMLTLPYIQQYKFIQHLPYFPKGSKVDKIAELNGISDPCDINQMLEAIQPLDIGIREDRLRHYVIQGCLESGRPVIGLELGDEDSVSGT